MALKREAFIPLAELAGLTTQRKLYLSKRQREIIKLHSTTIELAKRADSAAKRVARHSGNPPQAHLRVLVSLERERERFATQAMQAAIKYYHSHGHIAKAADELPGFAQEHWEPLHGTTWGRVFFEHAVKLTLTLKEFQHLKARQLEDEIATRQAEAGAFRLWPLGKSRELN